MLDDLKISSIFNYFYIFLIKIRKYLRPVNGQGKYGGVSVVRFEKILRETEISSMILIYFLLIHFLFQEGFLSHP